MITQRPYPAINSPWMTPNREPNDQLQPLVVRGSSGGTGVYDELETGHPKIADAYSRLATALATMPVEWHLEDPTDVEQMVIDDLHALWLSLAVDADNGIRGPGSVLQQAVTFWSRGNCVFALRWIDSRASGRRFFSLDGLDIEAYPVHPSSILRWITTRTGKLEGVQQSTYTGSATLARESLIVCSRMAVPGQWEGTSLSRPLIFPFERWKSIWMSAERNSWMMAGVITLVEPPGANPTDRERANVSLEKWMNGNSPFLILPNGWTVEFSAPSAAADAMAQIDKIDSYVDTTLGNQVAALSYAAHATRALGDTLSEADAQDASKEIGTFLALFGGQLAQWVCEQIGYEGRIPVLRSPVSADAEFDPAAITAAMGSAKSAGLIEWRPEDERFVRHALKLPVSPDLDARADASENAEAVAAVDPAAPVAALSDDAARADAPAPPDAQRTSAAALMHRRSSADKWQGTPPEIVLAKSIAGGQPLPMLDLRMLEAYFDDVGDPTTLPGWADRGPAWQKFNAFGGEAMATYLGRTLADTDGVPVDAVAMYDSVSMAPAKFDHIDFTPPEGVREAAKRAMEVRAEKPDSQQGMTPVGIARARDLANGRTVSPDTARRMLAYFERHEVDKKGETWDEQGKGWQAWHGWGGDAGWSWARKLVKQMDAADAKMSDRCGCSSCVTMAAVKGVIVIGADGRPFTAPAALQGVETFVSWADNDDQRRAIDAALQLELDSIATRHRAETWRALRDGWQPGESAALLARFTPRYQRAYETYGRDIAMMVSRWTAEEAIRQGESDGRPRRRDMATSTALFRQVLAAADERMTRAAAGLDMAARDTATRVQSDVERAWRAGVKQRAFVPVFTSLAEGARAPAQMIESEGRVAAAADMVIQGEADGLGLEPARVVRTSIMDLRRCEVCADLSQTTFELPEQMAQWQAMPLPDPNCEGGAERCRCGWLVEWRR
jgi:hypothetical protein